MSTCFIEPSTRPFIDSQSRLSHLTSFMTARFMTARFMTARFMTARFMTARLMAARRPKPLDRRVLVGLLVL
jgi:hypothetical protein